MSSTVLTARVDQRRLARRSRARALITLSAFAAAGGLTTAARADTYANNGGLALNLAASWFNQTTAAPAVTPPGAADIARWDSLSPGGTFTLGTATSWQGIAIVNPTAAVVLGGVGDTGNSLTLGTSGIDMSAATQNLTINNPIILGSAQTWNVATGRTLASAATTGTLNLGANALTVQGAGNVTSGAAVAGAGGSIVMSGTGTWLLSVNGTFTGGATVNSGRLTLNAAAAAGTGQITLNNGSILKFGVGLSGSTNYANAINVPTGAIVGLEGTGGDQVNGAWTGGGTINASFPTGTTLSFTNINTLQNFGGTINMGASVGTLRYAGSSSSGNAAGTALDLGTSTAVLNNRNSGTFTWGSLAGGAGTIVRGADGTNAATTYAVGALGQSTVFAGTIVNGTSGVSALTHLTVTGGTLTLTGTNTYTGLTTINSGATLRVGNNTATGKVGTGAVVDNGTLTYSPAAASTFTVTNDISGTGSFTHTGAGTTTLSGNNTFSGGSNLNAGLVQANNVTSALGTGAVAVNSGASLGGRGSITAAVTANSGAILAPGNVGVDNGGGFGVGTLTTSSLNVVSGAILNYDFSIGSNDLLAVTTANGLSVGGVGGGISLIKAGTTSTPFKTDGIYNIFSVAGGYTGSVTNLLPVLNPQTGVSYNWGVLGDFVTLTILGGDSTSVWNQSGGGSWGTASNWNGGVPNAPAATATLGNSPGITAASTVLLNGDKTVGILVFNNNIGGTGNVSYTVAPGSSGTLILDNTPDAAAITVANGTHLISAPVRLDTNTTISVNNAVDTMTLSGAVSGTGVLTQSGLGTLVLAADNTYSGNTLVNSGNLRVGAGGTTGSLGTGNVTNNATITFNRSDAVSYAGIISGSGGITQGGSGTLTIGGVNTYTGTTTVSSGVLKLGTGASIGGGPVAVNAGTFDLNGNSATFTALSGSGTIDNTAAGVAALSVGNTLTSTFAGTITDTGGALSLTKIGTGQLQLSGANTYSGSTTVSAGSIRILTGGSLDPTGTIFLNSASAVQNLQLGNGVTISNPITASVGSNEAFDVFEAGANATLAGPITVNGGGHQLRLGTTGAGANLTITGAAVAGAANTVVLTRGSLTLAGSGSLTSTFANNFLVNRAGAFNLLVKDSATISAANFDAGNNQAGAGSLTMTVQNNASVSVTGSFNLNNINNSTSSAVDIAVNDTATLAVGSFLKSKADLAHPTTLLFNGGTLAANSSSAAFLPSFAGLDFTIDTNGMKVDSKAFNITIAHPLKGTGPLTKLGTGTLILSGINEYSGATSVNAGLLDFAVNDAFGGTSSIRAAANAAVGVETGSLDAGFLAKLIAGAAPASAGALALSPTVDSAAPLDFTTGTLADPKISGMSVGALPAGVTYTGTITPASSTYRLGGGGTLTLANVNALTGANAVVVTNGGAVVVANTNDYTGSTTVSSGSLTINTAGSIGSTSITVAPGATMNINGSVPAAATVNANGVVNFGGTTGGTVLNRPLAALNIGSGVTAKITASTYPFTPTVLHPTTLSFANATAKIDITNNELITTGTLAGIVPLLNQQIITTSTGGLLGTLQVGADVRVRYTLGGDTNLDGKVEVGDLGNLASNYGSTAGGTWVQGDFNYDGMVDVGDLGTLATNYGGSLATSPSAGDGGGLVAENLSTVASGAGSAAVPEPASLGIVGLGAVALLARRRRRVLN